uniref:Receptor protein-tyrosine kinase n=1 Tax=Branchiostoma floridae TaxID=7739 RepID=C3ZRK1_BRAFL|eukprot:XP_002588790.1 hypothetical protein BRAFLDRAFT_89780 [Branchiostoma floridae]
MDKNMPFFVLLTCLAVLDSVQGTLQLSANVPENAHAGETVTSVRSAIGEGKEEVRCEIVAGDKNRRFSVTNCVIQVARPLDYGVDPTYNLTVNVIGSSGNPEQLYVDVQVQDVEGYPPVYNDTCEMPTRTAWGNSGDLNVDMKWTVKGMSMNIGEVFFSNHFYYNPNSVKDQVSTRVYSDNNNCLVQFVWKPMNGDDITFINSLWSTSIERPCLNCSGSPDGASVLQFEVLHSSTGFTPSSSGSCYTGPIPQTDRQFIFGGSLTISSMKRNLFTCDLPDNISVSLIPHGNGRDVIPLLVEFDAQPVGCPPNKYGVLCDQNCTCENGARCHGLNGACKCQPGWQGVVCDIPHSTVVIIETPSDSRRIYISGTVTLHCKVFHLTADRMMWKFPNKTEKWLQGAQEDRVRIHKIQSEHNGTYTCTVLTGDGTAINASYELQAVACPPGKTGESCEEECVCSHGGSCDRWAGCVCPPGWTGTTCQTSCPVGTYGQGCSRRCRCQHDATCSPTHGRCNCTEGWFDNNCSRRCPAGRYGWKCRHACACKNNAKCNNVDGTCACVSPCTGKLCDVIETETYTFPLSLQIAIPLVLTLLVTAPVVLILYKRKKAKHDAQEEPLEETRVLLELRSMEDDLAQSLQPGWLNRWERNADDLTLDELIGLGATAQIRKGRLRTADADVTVAVKSVRIEDRRCYRAFCREVAALIAVHENSEEENGGHPNIVKLFGVVTMSTPKCILLEFAAKGELLLILKQPRQNRPLGRFVRYAVQISRALEELRRLRIAHGDVAARNVLVSGDDVAKLADFGLAHDVYTETTYVPAVNDDVDELLPLKWMALESLESREFTCESDTWSFGVLLWEIAAFGEEPSYQRQRQLSCPKLVGLLRQGVRLDRPPGCPDKLYDVMKSCWREEPSARPEPAELEQRLTECCQELDPLLAVDN